MELGSLGIVTLGQSPRVDVTPEIGAILGDGVEIVEAGALDDADDAMIAALAPRADEVALVSRLRDGRGVELAKSRLLPLIEGAMQGIAGRCDAILLLCSGKFPPLDTGGVPVYFPEPILHGAVRGLLHEGECLGVVAPLQSQARAAAAKWADVSPDVAGVCASPYGNDDDLRGALRELHERGATLIVLDCMGFAQRHSEVARRTIETSVVRAPSLIARVLGEVL